MEFGTGVHRQDLPSGTLAEALLAEMRRRLPVLDRALTHHGPAPVRSYLDHALRWTPLSHQPRTDVAAAMAQCAAGVLGEEVARAAAEAVRRRPVVLTANHHGVDFFAQSVQSTLFFAMGLASSRAEAVPVLACASVPLDNVTFPRGALIYGCEDGAEGSPRRLAVFTNRHRRQMLARVPAFDTGLVERARASLARMHRAGQVAPRVSAALDAVLAQDYGSADVLGRARYTEQATVLNARLWQRLFAGAVQMPPLACLELEQVAGVLLAEDLRDPDSLFHAVAFHAGLRDHLLRVLDGARGCWQQEAMARRGLAAPGSKRPGSTGCGTFLFWGLDDQGRRVPLAVDDGQRIPHLSGITDGGLPWRVALEPGALVEALEAGRLLPSLFSCFLAIALARGVTCAGGYYQAEYLSCMQRGLVASLGRHGAGTAARLVARVPTDAYLSGMQAVMWRDSEGGLAPAGPVEIIAGGGLDLADLERMGALSVTDVHLASLSETVADAGPDTAMPGWQRQLARDCARLLDGRIVVK